jgi:hypothetical protein
MLESTEPISKPLPCHQIWDEMLPVDGGRICTGCGKLVVDFRNHKWREIEQAQRESIVPLCGIYNPKQIENWGSEVTPSISGCSRMVRLSAALLAFAQIAPGNLPAQTNTPQHQVPPSDQKTKQNPPVKPKTNTPPAKRIISGTVATQVSDTTKLPLACAELTLVRGTKIMTAETDSFGRYSLDLSNIYTSLKDTFEIVITHPAHSSHTIKCARKDLKPNQRNVVDVVLWDASVVAKKPILISNGSHFMAMINPPEEKAKALPANNTKLKKEGKFKRWWRHLWKKG